MNADLHHAQAHPPDKPLRRILPPYARDMNAALWRHSVWVLTGTDAWSRAKSRTWFPGQKVLLPYGEAIGRYRWPVSGRDCIVASFGQSETRKRLIELSVALVQDGAAFVIWSELEYPAPIFRPSATGIAA
jgi:hypothetical protein